MKRYSMTQVFMGLGCAMIATHDGNYVLYSEAQEQIDALKAQQWRDIKSAPRDGLVLLLRTKYEVHSAYFSDDHQDWVSNSADNVRINDPTGWLPAP